MSKDLQTIKESRASKFISSIAYLKHPLQVLIVIRINSLNVMISNLHTKNVFVE